MQKGLALLLCLACAAVVGAVVADRYGHAAAGPTMLVLLSLAATLFGLFVWREPRAD